MEAVNPTGPVNTILSALASGNSMVRQAQQSRLFKNPAWRPVLEVIKSGKPYTGPALTAGIPSENALVAISQLNAADAMNLCQVLHRNRAYRGIYVGLKSGRTYGSLPGDGTPEVPFEHQS